MASDAIHFLTAPPSREVAEQNLLPAVRDWFRTTIGAPTLAQRFAWGAIGNGQNLLLAAATGSGKTLAAFLPILSTLLAEPTTGLQCLYVAPLKALCRDVRANLKQAWRSLRSTDEFGTADIRFGLRTGDTPTRVRQRQIDDPPSVLITTPESLAQMLANPRTHSLFQGLRWVIIDEIHALAENKRGADLAVSLERIEALVTSGQHSEERETGKRGEGEEILSTQYSVLRTQDVDSTRWSIQRIGLSATCTPLAQVARFLVGVGRSCAVAAAPDRSEKHFAVEPLFENLEYSPGWLSAVLDRLDHEFVPHRTTLIFTNTRNLAERLTWALRRRYPDRQDDIGVHHSALSPIRRRIVERRMKQGRLWVVVSSTSLELGIDIGSVVQVVFIHPPGGVVRLLQRVGRSGHRPDEPRRGLLLTASPSELLESVVTACSGQDGQIEPVRIIGSPLDVLCQQIVGMAMADRWTPTAALDLIRRAAPFHNLTRQDFDDCLDYLSGRKRDGTPWLPARLSWNGDRFTIADERTSRLLRRNLGTILTEDSCAIRLRAPTDDDAQRTHAIGDVDMVYAERLQPGDRFVLDGRCLELKEREHNALLVDEAWGRPLIPRWLGAGAPMSGELARRLFLFRTQAAELLRDGSETLHGWLRSDYRLGDAAIAILAEYLCQQECVSEIPVLSALLIESVAMQSCIEYFVHTPLPRSANETIARVLLHRWRHTPRAKAKTLASDLGLYVLVDDSTAITPEAWRRGLDPAQFVGDFQEHLASSELLAQQFGRTAQTGLMVLRNPAGRKRKVGGKDWTERRLFEQISTQAPDFVLLRQAEIEVATSACDLRGAKRFVEALASMPIRVRHLSAPSPFGESLLGGGFREPSMEGA